VTAKALHTDKMFVLKSKSSPTVTNSESCLLKLKDLEVLF